MTVRQCFEMEVELALGLEERVVFGKVMDISISK